MNVWLEGDLRVFDFPDFLVTFERKYLENLFGDFQGNETFSFFFSEEKF